MTSFGRIFRKLLFGGVFLFFVAISLISVYKTYFPVLPSCTDNIKNQDEAGIDCGGICEEFPPYNECSLPLPPADIKPIEVVWAKAFYSDIGVYDLAAKINNDNINWGISEFEYEFIVKDARDETFISQRRISYILPQGYDYVVIPSVRLDKIPVKVELNIIKESQKWTSLDSSYDSSFLSFPFKEKMYTAKNENGISVASAKLMNATVYDFSKIDIKVILFNEKGEPIAANITNQNTVRSGEERFFSTLWSIEIRDEVFNHDFKATTNVFDSQNFMSRFGTGEENVEYRQ